MAVGTPTYSSSGGRPLSVAVRVMLREGRVEGGGGRGEKETRRYEM